jgi:two-component system, NtrC family, response regulator AtoC
MAEVFALIERVAASPISVLVLGETGTGKEVIAETLWKKSPRAKKPLLRINCAAFAEHLLESELFGHERGAFTGASEAKTGLFEAAHEGTLFLDEIGELPPATQAKLLRVLEDREVRRIGATAARKVDVRFVAATNRDLEGDARAGRFRADLLYRINGISIRLPALRDRRAEIVPLAESFVGRFADLAGRAPPHLDRSACDKLLAHDWPGNVRELRNVMERALLYAAGDVIEARHLDLGSAAGTASMPPSFAPSSPAHAHLAHSHPSTTSGGENLTAVQREERARIVAVLAECAGNQTHAARRLGISRGTLVARLAQYDVPRPRK